MTDRELLELAAKAAGIEYDCFDKNRHAIRRTEGIKPTRWNPLVQRVFQRRTHRMAKE